MSNKMHCPGCDSYSSTILAGVEENGECPVCHLPADVIALVERAQQDHSSAKVVDQIEEDLVVRMLEAVKAERVAMNRVALVETRLHKVKEALEAVRDL